MASKRQHFTNEIISRVWFALAGSTFPAKNVLLDSVRNIRRKRKMLATSLDAWTLASLAASCSKVAGSAAEVGTYAGATAALIASQLQDKTIYACDCFDDGLPAPGQAEHDEYWAIAGGMSRRYIEVKGYLAQWQNIQPIRGQFPQSAPHLADERFAFVHLDVDLYESTRDSLQWFYPRLSRGAILVTHDWNLCPGVKLAFDEVMQGKPEHIIELPTNQALFVKL